MSDYIKREDAVDAIVKHFALNVSRSYVENILDDVPSADVVEHKCGKWIDLEIPLEDGGSMPVQACNICKTFYPLSYTGGGHHFCPNCGADMRGREYE